MLVSSSADSISADPETPSTLELNGKNVAVISEKSKTVKQNENAEPVIHYSACGSAGSSSTPVEPEDEFIAQADGSFVKMG